MYGRVPVAISSRYVEPEVGKSREHFFQLVVFEKKTVCAKCHVQPVRLASQHCGKEVGRTSAFSIAYKADRLDPDLGGIVQKTEDNIFRHQFCSVILQLSVTVDALVGTSAGQGAIDRDRCDPLAGKPSIDTLLMPLQFVTI